MSGRALRLVLIAALAAAPACRRAEPAGEGGGAVLLRNLLRAREIAVVVEEPGARDAVARAAARLSTARPEVRFDAFVSASPSVRAPRIVVGTARSPLALELARSIGVDVGADEHAGTFRYGGLELDGPADGLVATFEDPAHPGRPLTLVLANEIDAAVRLADPLQPGWRPWIRVMRAGKVALSGPLDVDGSARPPDLVRTGALRQKFAGSLQPIAQPKPGILGLAAADLDPALVDAYGEACVRARETLLAWLPAGTQLPAVRVRLWSEPEEYAVAGDPDALSALDRVDRSVDALVWSAPGPERSPVHDGGACVAESGALHALGAPAQAWMLEAAGVDAAWTWWGRDLPGWLAHLWPGAFSGETVGVTVRDLVDDGADAHISPHLLAPLRGALWRFLRTARGGSFVRELWQGTRDLSKEGDLDPGFVAWIHSITVDERAADERTRADARARALAPQVLRGAAVGAPAWDPRTDLRLGYGSRALDASVGLARESGADALLVTVFAADRAGLADPAGATADPLRTREGDVRAWATLVRARARGLRTLLAPELLASDTGTWSGTWGRADEAAWRAYFEAHARLVEHAGLLATLADGQVLSLGTGLASVSGARPEGRRPNPADVEWKRAGWERVIGAARAAFAGALVYSAATPNELADIAFFPRIDLVGYALAPTLEYDDPWDGRDASTEIGLGIQEALFHLDRASAASGRRVLITQACFSPDLHGAARVLGPDASSRAWQARQLLILGDALRTWSARDRLAGVCAWRWAADEPAWEVGAHDPVIADPVTQAAAGVLWRGL